MNPHQTTEVLSATGPEPVALWTFEEDTPPYRDVGGTHQLELGEGAAVHSIDDPTWGRAATFDGRTDFLRIDATDVGDLNAAAVGDAVTVLAWVRRRTPGLGFIAGMWQEHDDDPRRQYGLFTGLGLYGGKDRVAGHVSQTGAASEGLPYSRDACASARMIEPESSRMIGFSYDGSEAISYLDGIADDRPDFTDPPAPFGQGLRYSKNPYPFPAGLNRRAVSDFTVGAVLLSRGMGNFFGGEIGGVAIYDRVLKPHEVMDIHLRTKPQTARIADLGFYRAGDVINEHHVAADWPVTEHGWKSLGSPSHQIRRDEGGGYLSRTAQPGLGSPPAAVVFEPIGGLPATDLSRIDFHVGGQVPASVLVRIDESWYAHIPAAGADDSADDGWRAYSTSLRSADDLWRRVNLTPAAVSDPSGTGSPLPAGQVTAVGFLDHGIAAGDELRISRVRLF